MTPSDMPIRMNFGNWNKFLLEMGYPVRKPVISSEARRNSRLAHKGKQSMAWKGGKHIDRHGYIQVWIPEHPNARMGGYIHEHRLIMSEYLGRPLLRHENVHHKNGSRSDNRLENLELWVTMQPSGQRPEDLVTFAHEILNIYENSDLIENYDNLPKITPAKKNLPPARETRKFRTA